MRIITLPTNYYQHFDADYGREVPAEGFGGWRKAELELDLDHTAVVVMHAWDCGTREQFPGWYNTVEYLPRANKILAGIFPGLLSDIRSSGVKLYHVVSGEAYAGDHPGYLAAKELAGDPDPRPERVKSDPVLDKLRRFKFERVHPGAHNDPDIQAGFKVMGFPKSALPQGNEGIAKDAKQLFALCKRDGVNHLIYIGFAINWCLLLSPGGMNDMQKHGIMCSAIRQAVTAVENRESARDESHKEEALWRTALSFGFVYDLDDFVKAIKA